MDTIKGLLLGVTVGYLAGLLVRPRVVAPRAVTVGPMPPLVVYGEVGRPPFLQEPAAA